MLVPLSLLCLAMVGCPLDGNREHDLRFPVTLTLENNSAQKLSIDSIYSLAAADGGFVLDAQVIAAGKAVSLRVPESTHELILAGDYAIDGRCGKSDPWTQRGPDVPQRALGEQALVLVVNRCQ